MGIEIIAAGEWTGTVEQCEWVRQFARDFVWGTPIDEGNEEHAADEVIGELLRGGDEEIDADEHALRLLRGELEESAARSRK